MSRIGSLINGIGVGAGLMYLFDPDRGNARRARLRDRCISLVHEFDDALRVGWRDLSNRAYGLACEAEALATGRREMVDDQRLVERVRARMGHVVTHPGAIGVTACDGVVTLSGPVLANEVERLLDETRAVPGVERVENQLDVHSEPGDISALQGSGRRGSLAQCAWTPATRMVISAISASCLLSGLWRQSAVNLALGTFGLGLLLAEGSNPLGRPGAGASRCQSRAQEEKLQRANGPLSRQR